MRRRGLSLLELLVALSIFGAAFVMLLAVFPTAARAVRQGEDRMVATFLVERRLEELRAGDFDLVTSGFQTATLEAVNAGVPSATTYTIQTNVTELEPGLKRVRALVAWTSDRARWVEVTTDVARLR